MARTSTAHLGELEAAIMRVLWEDGGGTVRSVIEVLHKKRRIAYTTVMTVMGRLVEKGILRRKLQGASYAYLPTRAREAYYADVSRQAVDDLLDSYGPVAVSAFLDRLEVRDPAVVRKLQQRYRAHRVENEK